MSAPAIEELEQRIELPIPPFDEFAQRMIDMDRKWVANPFSITLSATPRRILISNPLRLYVKYILSSGNESHLAPRPLVVSTTNGDTLAAVGQYAEYFPGKDGKICTSEWWGVSSLGGELTVYECVYRGDTTIRGT